ncbi:MAG: FecR family protein [Parachlamydiales bacterium]|nr:FecR family protein [Parachlamydiales bacterium]
MRVFFLLFALTLFAADPIGKVTAVDGNVLAKSSSGERTLTAGSDIFLKETIVVAVNALAQIQFTDGGIINLISGTEYRVNTYKYQKTFQKDQSSSELLKGGFRVLTGSIGKSNPNNYEIKTPSATIGLRGTIVEARMVDGALFVGVDAGKALVSNSAGSALIGVGEKASFVKIPGPSAPPEVTVQRPLELERNLFNPPVGGLSIDAQPQAAAPAEAAPKGAAQPAAPESPAIGETPDQGGDLLTPTGGGASIQGGC